MSTLRIKKIMKLDKFSELFEIEKKMAGTVENCTEFPQKLCCITFCLTYTSLCLFLYTELLSRLWYPCYHRQIRLKIYLSKLKYKITNRYIFPSKYTCLGIPVVLNISDYIFIKAILTIIYRFTMELYLILYTNV